MTELGPYMYVLLSDARAAINDAENLAYERGVKAGYAAVKEAERDMLAKCIDAVEAAARDRIHDLRTCNKDDDCYVKAEGVALMLDDALYELRALQEKP